MGKKDEFKDLADLNMFSADSSAPGYDDMYDEEYAAEITGDDRMPRSIIRTRDERPDVSHSERADTRSAGNNAGVWGAVAILAAIASWVIWPTVLGPFGAIAGVVAYMKGRRSLGGWAFALGTISFIFFLIAAY